jgi:hypothetical protein
MKNLIKFASFSICLFLAVNLNAQTSWAVTGNSITAGNFIGTTNNLPLIFKVNNIQKIALSPAGQLQLAGLVGNGNRFLQADGSGNLVSFPAGQATQVLFGNGTWGNLPVTWQTGGANLYYTAGKVGIGTSTPTYSLDVAGTAGISSDLNVSGAATVIGSLKLGSTSTPITINALATNNTKILAFGRAPLPAASCAPAFSALDIQFDRASITNPLNSNVLDFRNDGTNAFIDYGSTPTALINPTSTLKINSYCSSNINMCEGGGNVYMCPTQSLKGKVGIGTDAPISKLELINNDPTLMTMSIAKIESVSQTRRMIFEPNLNLGDYNPLTAAHDAGIFWSDGNGGASRNADAGFVIAPWPTSGASTYNPGIRITSSGRVGIGIMEPDAMLDVNNKNVYKKTGIKVTNNFSDLGTELGIGVLSIVNNGGYKAFVAAVGDGVTNTENFVVYGDGYVFARDIKVSLNPISHPDFVFEKSYRLKPLAEVEQYIQQNGHLENIPSTCEIVESKGVQLGEMSEKQLQKIEELTLYIIELNKSLEQMKATVKFQQQQIETLNKK